MSNPDIVERLAYRLEVWKHLLLASGSRCRACGDRGQYVEVRDTPGGALCIACWVTHEACAGCGLEAGIYAHRKAKYCAACLNPDQTADEAAELFNLAVTNKVGEGVILWTDIEWR